MKPKFLDKLFPEPVPGSARIIPSRHPIQVWLLIGLIISSAFQMIQGTAPNTPGGILSPPMLMTILLATIIGSVLCLGAAFLAESKPWDAMGLSMGGFFILTTVFLFSCWIYTFIPFPWLRRDFWVTIALTVGCLWRFLQLLSDAYRTWRHQ